MKSVLLSLAVLSLLATAHADPTDAPGWFTQGSALYQQKDYDGALSAYAKSLRLDNHSASAYQGVGNCYMAKGERALAIKYYGYALQLAPNNAPLRAYVAQLQGAAAAGPPASNDDYIAANQLYREHHFDDAISSYKKDLAVNAQRAKAWQGLGNCYYAQKKKPEALESYHKALELDPSNASLAKFINAYQAAPDSALASAAPSDSSGGPWQQAAWRSAILPGWGQAYNGQTGKGVFLGGLTFGLLAGEVVTYVVGSNARDQYNNTTAVGADYDTPYNTWTNMANMNHLFYIGMGAAYAYTLVDAIYFAHPKGSAVAYGSEPPVDVAFDDHGFMLKAKVLEF